MAVVVFLWGCPGSGKSLAARYIKTLLDSTWQAEHITDYSFLLDMFKAELKSGISEDKRKFRHSAYGGFDVVDFSVLDTALEMVNAEVCRQLGDQRKLILVEFARNSYSDTQQIFKEIYGDAHFLYFEAKIETCIQRVQTRAQRRETLNDNFVSEKIMREYYGADYSNDWFEGKNDKVEIIQNDGTWEGFGDKIQRFLKNLLRELESEAKPESALLSPALASIIV
jgi:chloramphenicol 3-O-phosphotransferase